MLSTVCSGRIPSEAVGLKRFSKISHSHLLTTAPPTNVGFTSTHSAGNFIHGKDITFTCTGTGADPTPTIEFYNDLVLVASGPGPSLSTVYPLLRSYEGQRLKCRAKNSTGQTDRNVIIGDVDGELNFYGSF